MENLDQVTNLEDSPRVSVIIPIYNTEKYLKQCLSSLENQTLKNIEVICINDGSTDNSLEIMQSYAERCANFRVVDKQNQGYGATCNRGLRESKGEYISIIEPDDWIEPTMYEDLIALADSYSEKIDIVKSAYWRISMPDTPEERRLHCSYEGRVKPKSQPFTIESASHLLSHHPSIWSAIYRRRFLDENNIVFKELPGAGWADNPFLIQTMCKAKNILYTDKSYYCYREDLPGSSSTLKAPSLPFDRWNDMMDILEDIHMEDEGVLRAHYSRGFTYLGGVIEEQGVDDPLVQRELKKMFSRMDKDIVLDDPNIAPGAKELYMRVLELPPRKIKKMPYYIACFNEFFFSIKNNGIGYAIGRSLIYLKNHQTREGR